MLGKGKSRIKKVIYTGFSAALVKLFSVIINLYTVPLTVGYLGTERYGLWMTISSVMVLLAFADFGLGNSLINSITKADSNKDTNQAQKAISSVFFSLASISILLLILFLSAFTFIDWPIVLNLKSTIAKSEASSTVFILVISLLLNLPLGVVQRVQNGYQQGFKSHLWSLLGVILSFIGILVCIKIRLGLPYLVFAFSIGPLISTLINGFYLFYHTHPNLKPTFRHFDLMTSRSLLKDGLVFFLLVLFTLITNASDNVVISNYLGNDSVAKYEIVRKLFLITMMTNFIIEPLWPAFGESIESGDISWARRIFYRVLFFSILTGAILALPLLFYSDKLLLKWIGDGFQPSFTMLLGFYSYIIVLNFNGVMSVLINSSRFFKKQLIPYALVATLSLLFKVFFIKRFGLDYVIWGSVFAWVIAFFVPAIIISKRILYINENTNDSSRLFKT